MTIVRMAKRDEPYAQICRSTLQDERLTYEAMGMLANLLSRPQNWRISATQLQRHCGRDKVYRILNELIEARYIKKQVIRNEAGVFVDTEYVVYETPFTENPQPLPENPYTENPDTVKTTLKNKELKEEREYISSPNGAQRENSEEADNVTSSTLSVVTPLVEPVSEPKTRKSKTTVAAAPKPRDPIFDAIAYARFGTCDVDKDTAKFVGNLRAAAWGAYQNQRAAHIAHLTQEQKVELCAKGIQRFEREWKQIKDSEGNPLRTISNRATYAEKFFAFLAEHPVGNAQPTPPPQPRAVTTTAEPPRFRVPDDAGELFPQKVSEGGDNGQ